jgi:integrase
VITFKGKTINDPYGAWGHVRLDAGDAEPDGPHVLRHTAATWLVQKGYELPEIASYLGMSVTTLTRVYWHRSPRYQTNIAGTAPKKYPRKA